jgi:hypothetical protein
VKDAFGVERVSKSDGPLVPEGRVKYSTYNQGEAQEWAKTAKVQSRNTAKGVEYTRPATHGFAPRNKGIKRLLHGRGGQPLPGRFEAPTGGIERSKYDSPAYLRAQRKKTQDREMKELLHYEKHGYTDPETKEYYPPMRSAKGVSKAFTIGDDKRVRRAKLKERQSGLNTDLAGTATAAGASHAAIGTYNRWAEKYPNLRQLKAPGSGALTNTRVLKPVSLAQSAGKNLPGKAGRIVSHPALLGGTVVAVGAPLTVANYRQHQRDEKRVHRLELRYPKKKEKS